MSNDIHQALLLSSLVLVAIIGLLFVLPSVEQRTAAPHRAREQRSR